MSKKKTNAKKTANVGKSHHLKAATPNHSKHPHPKNKSPSPPLTTTKITTTGGGGTWSKSKKKRMRQQRAKKTKYGGGGSDDEATNNFQLPKTTGAVAKGRRSAEKRRNEESRRESDSDDGCQPLPSSSTTMTVNNAGGSVTDDGKRNRSALQESFMKQLSGSRFRELNEELYTKTSDESFQRFSENPELFTQYHEGYRTQVNSWPVNPVDIILESILSLQQERTDQNNKNKTLNNPLTIADFGCGDAKLATELLKQYPPNGGDAQKKVIIHSFDLVDKNNPLVTACDMAHTPLSSRSVDVGVFCLSLMGTNMADFIREAHRVMKPEGVLHIAEVRSRFESTTIMAAGDGGKGRQEGGAAVDRSLMDEFLTMMGQMGFDLSDRTENKMFFLMEFRRSGRRRIEKDVSFTARPCVYKRR